MDCGSSARNDESINDNKKRPYLERSLILYSQVVKR